MGKKRKASARPDGDESRAPEAAGKPIRGASSKQKTVKEEKSCLIFEPRPDWHAAELPKLPIAEDASPLPRDICNELQHYADEILEADSATYKATRIDTSSSKKFMSTIMESGTLEDKVSAQTLLIQESPVHTRKVFENLLTLSKKKNRNQALLALSALKDLLGRGVILPPERKLRAFARQPELISAFKGRPQKWVRGDRLPGKVEKAHLISWAYEDWLKKTYFDVLEILEQWCNDEITYSRSRAVTFVWELLKEKPEQEENLLRLLIYKLGDLDKKIASRASHLILQLETLHPLMKSVIINAIQSELLFKPGQSSHAKYYAIITLNQTILNIKEHEVANKLLETYFSLFIELLEKTNSNNSKNDSKPAGKNGVTQGGGGKPGKKAKQKLKEKEKQNEAEIQLGDKMIAQVLTGVNRAFPFANTDDATFESQLDTIFRVTHSSNFNTSIQALMLIQQITQSKAYAADRFYRTLYESLLDSRLLTSSKQVMYLNLLYRSLKADVSIKRVKAFVKRLLQVVSLHEPPFVCGVLFLIQELETTFPSIRATIEQAEHDGEDEEEHFYDAPEEGADVSTAQRKLQEKSKGSNSYDSRKRDPEHSNAEKSCLWEINPFMSHFHPTVSLYASRIITNTPMTSKPDPTLHTLIHFLDRFVYRNAKSKAGSTRGTSIMQPLAGTSASDLLIKERYHGKLEVPLNTEAFWKKKIEDVSVDEVFFHAYFNQAGKARIGKKKKDTQKDGDESGDEEDEEEEIWKALVDSKPEIEGDEDEDMDDGFEDLMSDDEGGINLEDGRSDDENSLLLDDSDEISHVDGQERSEDDFDAVVLDSDEDAFIQSDDDIPSDMDIIPNEDQDSAAVLEGIQKSKKGEDTKGKSKKRRKLKHLPTFASAEDYAKLIGDDDDV
ncbi:CBF-domain-containing protein [Patellaria atrata CBS 101060]|uniref:CBF-domain-containing protein n=1 Tax=Patellaria atrata CBS 101060 TaxID=1346257 RepID=A0A9P4SHN7_9PEZI|nr:CBF-domain-containing protein [Patellaria atrata CBS 101060]